MQLQIAIRIQHPASSAFRLFLKVLRLRLGCQKLDEYRIMILLKKADDELEKSVMDALDSLRQKLRNIIQSIRL